MFTLCRKIHTQGGPGHRTVNTANVKRSKRVHNKQTRRKQHKILKADKGWATVIRRAEAYCLNNQAVFAYMSTFKSRIKRH